MNNFFVIGNLLSAFILGGPKDDDRGAFLTHTFNEFRTAVQEFAEGAGVPPPKVILHINRERKFEGRTRVFVEDTTRPDVWGIEVDPAFLLKMSEHRKKFAAAFLICDKKLGGAENTQASVIAPYLVEVKKCACYQLGLVIYIEVVLEDLHSAALISTRPIPTRDQIEQRLRDMWGGDLPLHPKTRR